jgi:hypothetical protein
VLFVQINQEVGSDQSGLRKDGGVFFPVCMCINENSPSGRKHPFVL